MILEYKSLAGRYLLVPVLVLSYQSARYLRHKTVILSSFVPLNFSLIHTWMFESWRPTAPCSVTLTVNCNFFRHLFLLVSDVSLPASYLYRCVSPSCNCAPKAVRFTYIRYLWLPRSNHMRSAATAIHASGLFIFFPFVSFPYFRLVPYPIFAPCYWNIAFSTESHQCSLSSFLWGRCHVSRQKHDRKSCIEY
jgi:hypothetical protein